MTLSNLERLSRCSGRLDGLRLDGLRRRLAMALVLDMAQRRAGTYNSSLSGRVRQKVLWGCREWCDGERQRLYGVAREGTTESGTVCVGEH